MKKKFNYAAMLLGSLALLAACGNGSNAESSAAEDDQFVVGLEAAYAPYNWTQLDDSNGGVPIDGTNEYAGGYDVEIAKKIAEGLGQELVIVKTEWDGLVPALQAKKIDAIIAGMSPTEERKQTISFSDPYLESQLVMVVASDSDFVNATKLADFNSAKVTAQLNTFHYNVIDQIEGVNKQTAMENFSAMRVALQAGVIDGYVSEYPEAVSASNANSDFSFVEFEDGFKTSPEDTTIAIGVRKDEADLDKMNAILSEISDEERQEIMDAAVANQPAAQQ
ncbi:ABC transporter substrate-binding protein [Jeotgalibaca sp. PTS2502]|nr:transporter substrate-binding domain-containing protein [Jeotgalibaca sp. PTS2502]APZ48793.1 ABC transporter substrate-binding protein [Jeotgalibaca sp. PTS2502]